MGLEILIGMIAVEFLLLFTGIYIGVMKGVWCPFLGHSWRKVGEIHGTALRTTGKRGLVDIRATALQCTECSATKIERLKVRGQGR